jgi:hypothetical protein
LRTSGPGLGVLEAPDHHRPGEVPVHAERLGQLPHSLLEHADVLAELAVDEVAAERVGLIGERVVGQHEAQPGAGVPVSPGLVLRELLRQILLGEHGVADPVEVPEVLDGLEPPRGVAAPQDQPFLHGRHLADPG